MRQSTYLLVEAYQAPFTKNDFSPHQILLLHMSNSF